MGARDRAEFTATDLEGLDAKRAVSILPVAAIKQHEPHLPMAVGRTPLSDR